MLIIEYDEVFMHCAALRFMLPDWFGVHANGVADCPVDIPTDGIMSLGI